MYDFESTPFVHQLGGKSCRETFQNSKPSAVLPNPSSVVTDNSNSNVLVSKFLRVGQPTVGNTHTHAHTKVHTQTD